MIDRPSANRASQPLELFLDLVVLFAHHASDELPDTHPTWGALPRRLRNV